MQPDVAVESTSLGEAVSAEAALEGLLAGVRPQVLGYLRWVFDDFVADIALVVRCRLAVHPHHSLQAFDGLCDLLQRDRLSVLVNVRERVRVLGPGAVVGSRIYVVGGIYWLELSDGQQRYGIVLEWKVLDVM